MRALACACLLLLPLSSLGGCSLTSKATPVEIRYFSPERIEARRPTRLTQAEPQPARAQLRLGRLTSSTNLRYRIVHRESAVELDAYETLRWTESPEDYVRRSLSRALFDDGGLAQVVGGAAVTLDVELVAFEEARRDHRHIGRVQIAYRLHDERAVLASGVVTVEREAAGDGIEPVVAAIGSAMDAATSELAQNVVTNMRGR